MAGGPISLRANIKKVRVGLVQSIFYYVNKEKLHQSSDFGAQGLFKLLRVYQSDNLYQSMLRLESDMNRKTGAN